jgi:N-acetylglucosamine-6-phosphate deacetylase
VAPVIVRAPHVLFPDGLVSDATVAIAGGRIVEASGAPDVVLPNGVLAPGLIDLQVNGFFGVDFAADDDWSEPIRRLPETGVTAFLPTFITARLDELVAGLRRVPEDLPGARVLGVHVEGPFLSEARRGAHDPALMCDPTPPRIEALLEPGTMALITLAPERSGAMQAISRLAAAGVLVSVGHSDATADVVAAAADAGARKVTHLFNAQRGIHHREPGVAGAALADERFVCGLILDGHHVVDTVARVAFAAAGGRIALVTDAIGAAGMPPGMYELGGEPVILREGGPPVRMDGTLAGAALRLDDAVARAISIGVSPQMALEAASRVPADVLGRRDLGRLEVGALADLVWLDDAWGARATWVGGELVHDELGVAA